MLFESPALAWHEAFSTREGMQDPYTPRGPSSTRTSGMHDVRCAELAKVRALIESLPDDLRHAGMWCFAPDGKNTYESRNRLMQLIWLMFCEIGPESMLQAYTMTVRATILVTAVLEEGRACAMGVSRLSEASVASRMGIDRSSFSRTWAESYRLLVGSVEGKARQALAEIDPMINDINARYTRAG